MGEQTESIGVALEMGQIGPLSRSQLRLKLTPGALAEKCRYGLFARMAERRIAKVMSQTSGGNDLPDSVDLPRPGLRAMTLAEHDGGLGGERAAHTGHFDRMRQSVVHEDAARKRKHLRLVLQTPEWRRKHQPVIVALEVAAHSAARIVIVFKPEALVAYQAVPVHFHRSRYFSAGWGGIYG